MKNSIAMVQINIVLFINIDTDKLYHNTKPASHGHRKIKLKFEKALTNSNEKIIHPFQFQTKANVTIKIMYVTSC